ncbi:VOC family protein [Ferrovibrio sp.]|uniref:VOC family protein n=1 Tax=Ferrovibrio sp. TaxID=1917215 RepID=UPI00311F2BC7
MTAVRLAYINLFSRDIVAQAAFYSALFGFEEKVAHRSPIYRCLDAGGVELGFNAEPAYDLLGLAAHRPASAPLPLGCYFTAELGSEADVTAAADRCRRLGGAILKPPYHTYYNAWQAVLADPEGNVFRVNHRIGTRTPFADLSPEQRPL